MHRQLSTLAIGIAVMAVGACAPATARPSPSAAAPTAASQAPTSASAPASPSASVELASPAMPSPVAVASREPDPELKLLWSANGPEGERPWTWTPSVDPDGRIWAASSFDDVFWIIDREGNYLESWGKSGTGEGQFRLAAQGNGHGAIAFREDGGFYVVDSGNSRVQQFDADRAFVREWGSFGTDDGDFVTPLDIDLDGEGNVYVYDGDRFDVQVFDAEGAYLRTAATGVGPYSAVDDDGTVFAVDNRTVTLFEFTPDGAVRSATDLSDVLSFATGFAIHPSGDLVMASAEHGDTAPAYESLIRLSRDGTLRNVWPNGAEAVEVDPAGDRVYLTYSDVNAAVEAYELPAD